MKARRFAAVALPRLRVELVHATEQLHGANTSGPLTIVLARPGGAVQSEQQVLGNTRIDEVSDEAERWGIRPGMTVASARAMRADMRVRVLPVSAVTSTLERLAEAAMAIGISTSFGFDRDVLWVDISGIDHLYKSGERGIAEALHALVRKLGHEGRIGIADGAYVAMVSAWYLRNDKRCRIVPPGGNAVAMRALPIDALPIARRDAEWLSRLGLRVAGDLQKLPRKTLAVRLGGDVSRVMALLAGEDSTAPTPHVPPEIPTERIDLDYGAESAEALVFVAKAACDRMSARLAGRQLAAAKLTLVLHLDRGVVRMIEDNSLTADKCPDPHLDIKLPTPVRDAVPLLSVVRVRLESWITNESKDGQGGSSLPAPVLGLTLRATELARPLEVPLDLFVREAKATRKLGPLLAELDAELGARVGTLAVADSWILEKRSRLVPVGGARPECTNQVSSFSPAEPLRLVPAIVISPDDLENGQLRLVRLLGRWEAVEWWRGEPLTPKDAFACWTNEQMAFVLRQEGRLWLRGWLE